MAAIDVTDATFQAEVIDKSKEVAVVVDLWAPWCGPCKTLGPIIEKVIDATDGKVVLAKVNVDENPGIAQAFQAQSIPAVYALKDGAVVDGFIGAYPEHEVQRFVDSLQPTEEQVAVKELIEAGDEGSLRIALSIEPANEDAIVALAELLIADGNSDEALALLGRIPESDRTRHVAALARVGQAPDDDYDEQLTDLARPGEDRRRGPPEVRRPARADGTERPSHRRLPAPAHVSSVLTRADPRRKNAASCDWNSATTSA